MKKLLVITIILTVLFSLCSCGNKAIFDTGNFNFKHVHIKDYGESHCLDIVKWWDYESGVEVELENGNGLFCSEGTYLLFESSADCPYC